MSLSLSCSNAGSSSVEFSNVNALQIVSLVLETCSRNELLPMTDTVPFHE